MKVAIRKSIKLLLLLVFVGWHADAAFAQRSDSQQAPSSRAKAASLLVEIERIGCLGPCPAYVVSFFSDGSVVYSGKKYVKLVGKHERKLRLAVLEELKQVLSSAQRTRFRTSYSDSGCGSIFTDYPWTIFRLNFRGRVSSIERSHGCFGGSEKFKKELNELDRLEESLGRIAQLHEWIGTEEEQKNLEYRVPLSKRNN